MLILLNGEFVRSTEKMINKKVKPTKCACCGGKSTKNDFCYGCDKYVCIACIFTYHHESYGDEHFIRGNKHDRS